MDDSIVNILNSCIPNVSNLHMTAFNGDSDDAISWLNDHDIQDYHWIETLNIFVFNTEKDKIFFMLGYK